jgi:tetratricopeptide (TPR) repeat protein/transcriptional regulator with XRE-family HTH domain
VRPRKSAALEIPDGLWDRPVARDALHRRDMSAVFTHFRRYTGASQTVLGSLVGLSQSDVSDIERGLRLVQSADVLRRCAEGLRIPGHLLGLAATDGQQPCQAPDRTDYVVSAPWNRLGTLRALQALITTDPGGPMERREFLETIAISALASAAARWLHVPADLPDSAAGRRVTAPVTAALHARLDALRHLDDQLGSGQLRPLATSELRLITCLLTGHAHDEATERSLYAAASEASRICGWLAYDSAQHDSARRHYLTAIRAADSSGDPLAGAHAFSYAAIQAYSTGRPRDAVMMLDAARQRTRRQATPRMDAMLHARQARAYSKTPGERSSCIRAINAAFDAHAQGARDNDPAYLYWVTEPELLGIAGSSALDLGDPAQAIDYFGQALAISQYDNDGYPRAASIYYARVADAHLALGQVEDACTAAHSALRCLGGVESARGTSTLSDCRAKLSAYKHIPAVSDFLDIAG